MSAAVASSPPAPSGKAGGADHSAVGRIHERQRTADPGIRGRQTAGVRRPEGRARHREGAEHPLLQHLVERLSGSPRSEHAEHLRAGAVEPRLARRGHQRQLREARQPGLRIGGRPGRRRPEGVQGPFGGRGHDRPRLRRDEHRTRHPHAPGEGQQITHGGPAGRGHGVVERAVRTTQHPTLGEFGEQPVERLVQFQRAVLGQAQHRRGGHRLAQRGNPEQRVGPHRGAAHRRLAGHEHAQAVPAGDGGHDAGYLSARRRRRDDLLDAGKSFRGECLGNAEILEGSNLPQARR